ncbi:ribonuclease E [Friedmanniella luteola]|uniref:Ribonuclease E n=1 Tax=Friedmanniella luteola TaxID=546871 RepID=A0A1H1XSH6_9ACTN|nr:Rne/Rng family ribonuclease [Friedmanniella luteola]SDT12167.1 ribonuclease E [Friedmanniella luteola]
MLDHEPDTHEPTEGTTPTTEQPAAARPRRRRAASRPAGPPAGAAAPAVVSETTPVSETPVPEAAPAPEATPVTAESSTEVPAGTDAPLPAKKTPRKAAAKRPAKKAAAKPAATDDAPTAEPVAETVAELPVAETPTAADLPSESPVEATPEAPVARKRAPRKRATKKATAPAAESSADDLVAEAAVPEAPAVVEAPAAETPLVDEEPAPALPPEPVEEPTTGAWAGEEAASEVPAALQQLAEAIARDGQPADAPEQALEETPAPDLAALEESPLDVLEDTVDDTQVQADDTAPADPDQHVPPSDAEQADPETAEDDEDGDEDESRDGDGSRRRRRRRGGRRRRRTGGDEDSAEGEDDAPEAPTTAVDETVPAAEGTSEASADGESDDEDSSDAEESDGSRRRRRRRRRRGEDTGSSADDPGEVVVRVREPRKNTRSASSEVTGIEGSTRMEAKRQRRRDGRDAGRRRAPILSEAEFLARRESVSRKMIVRQADDLSQIAVIEDDILVEHYVDRDSAASLIGNVYLGRVQNVLPSMEAAFIDIGRGRNAVLYAGEVDWDSFGAEGQGRKVERVLKSGQTILVQVTKDPVGAKGARLTNHVSIPGRYIVYAPSGHLSGISRKLPDTERRRLKEILADLIGEASVIVRTAAEGASEEELVRDVNRLKAQWADIEKKVSSGQSPQQLYGEPDLTVRIVRDLFTEDFSELIIQGNGGPNDASVAVESYVTHVAPHLQERISTWDPETQGDLFAAFRLDEQIAKGLERKVFLPSGGSLVIDRTEAMTVIDVNTGKFTGSGGNLEATVTSNNLEAAEEIVRQLRLRDIGGIIVIDFIDMVLPANRELLLRRLVECLGRDRTRHQVAEVTSLGLVQMTRKKIGTGLAEAFTSECPHCHGRGVEIHDLPVESQRQADGGTRDSGRGDANRGDSGRGGRRGGGNQGGGSGGGNGGRGESSGRGDGGGRGENGGRGDGGQRQPRPSAPSVPAPVAAVSADEVAEVTSAPAAEAPVEAFVPDAATTDTATSDTATTGTATTDAPATAAPEPTSEPAPAAEPEERPRGRRGGTRRRAVREQGAPSVSATPAPAATVADPQAAPAADPQGEPVPSS